jgi:protein-disulfide isomerase
MPWLGGTTGPGKRASAGPREGKLSTRARVIAGAMAALAVLAVLAVAARAGSGHPARVRAASGTTTGAGASPAAPPGAGTPSPGAANPNPSAHPVTGPTPPALAAALTLGRPNAPVTIVEFGDYQCTNCGAFARDTEPALIRRYVNTGVVRVVWRDFPWVDAQSVRAAVAARAAGMQGKFWAYHNFLFAHQFPDEHSGLVTDAYLRSVARRLGLNMTRVQPRLHQPGADYGGARRPGVRPATRRARHAGVPDRRPAVLRRPAAAGVRGRHYPGTPRPMTSPSRVSVPPAPGPAAEPADRRPQDRPQ